MTRNVAIGLLIVCLFLGIPSVGSADTCLQIENLKGRAAYSHEDYEIMEDGFGSVITFCYEGDYGKFDNNEGIFQRFGSNTWIWFNASEATEIAEVWTFDFATRKVLFARTRGAGSALPASVGAFVGDITGTEVQ